MAEFTFNVPDDQVPRLLAGLCGHAGVETSAENARAVAAGLVRSIVSEYEYQEAANAAAAAVTVVSLT